MMPPKTPVRKRSRNPSCGETATIHCNSFGLRLEIRVPEDLRARTASVLPPGGRQSRVRPGREPGGATRKYRLTRKGGPGQVRSYCLYRGRVMLTRSATSDAVLDALERDIQHYVAEHALDRIFVHAGTVGWKGKALLVPGRSRSGKSTLVAALVRRGAVYYSDEYAVLDRRGRVHPYARPLSLRENTGGSVRIDPHALLPRRGEARPNPRVGRGSPAPVRRPPLPVGWVLVTRYERRAAWRARELSPGRALLALLENTVAARGRSGEVMPALARAVAGARTLSGLRGEATPFARRLLFQLEREQ